MIWYDFCCFCLLLTTSNEVNASWKHVTEQNSLHKTAVHFSIYFMMVKGGNYFIMSERVQITNYNTFNKENCIYYKKILTVHLHKIWSLWVSFDTLWMRNNSLTIYNTIKIRTTEVNYINIRVFQVHLLTSIKFVKNLGYQLL